MKHRSFTLHFCLILCLNLCIFYTCFGQQSKGKRIECTANILQYDAEVDPDVQILNGNVVFSHEGAVCYADTAFYNQKLNVIEAFGKELVIHLNDSVHLYGKYLIYDGNTKILTIERNVMLFDEYSILYTDKLTYNRTEDVAFYSTGGKIVNDSNTLVSQQGWYYTIPNDVYFKNKVILTTPNYNIHSDTLKYNTESKISYFLGPTNIHSEENTIYCEYGWYDTKSDISEFRKNAKINNKIQKIKGDIIWYDKINEIGIARNNVFIIDSVENIILTGKYAEYNTKKHFSLVTDSAVAIYIDKKDSLFLHSDTLYAGFDTNQSLQYLSAYHKVLFFRKDLQGSCDSLVYLTKDSIITLFRSPILWSEHSQLLADTIQIYTQNRQMKEAHLINNAFLSQNVFNETRFNQIKGLNMYIYFNDNKLDYLFVDTDAESLYYVQEEDSSLIGINESISEQMRIRFADNEISSITFYNEVKGDMSPENKKKEVLLKDFIWLNDYRPKNKSDIFMQKFYKPELKIENEY